MFRSPFSIFAALTIATVTALLSVLFPSAAPTFVLLFGALAFGVVFAEWMPSRSFRVASVAILAAILLLPALVYAQTTITSTAPSDTTINVGQLLAPWLQGLIAAAVAVIMALFGWITQVINKRAGLEGNAAVMQMEEYARNALDSGLTTAAGWIIMKAGPSLDQMTFDVKSPLIVQGISVLNNLAGDAIAKFGLTPDDLAKKLIAKIGVVTAPNPSVTPTTTVTAPTA